MFAEVILPVDASPESDGAENRKGAAMVKSADYHRGRAAGLAWAVRLLRTWYPTQHDYQTRLREEAARSRAKAWRGKRG